VNTNETNITEEQYEEISLVDLAIIFAKQKKTIILTTLLFVVAGFAYVFAFGKPVLYKSSLQMMVIMPNIVSEKTVALNVSNSLVNGIVSSDATKDAIIDKYDLGERKKEGEKGFRERMHKLLDENMKVETNDQTGVITLSVCAKTAEKARDIATYVYELTDNKLKEITNTSVAVADEVNTAVLEKELKSKMGTASQTEMLKLYDVLVAKEESAKMRDKLPVSLQQISPASVTDKPEPRGRGKTVVLFTMLGFFLGLVLAFMKYVWSTVDEGKKQEFKAALKFR